MFPKEFLAAIPKTDLHLHLDGSLRLSTLIALAKDQGVELPSFTESGLRDLVFKDSYANLNEYLAGFAWTGKVLQDPDSLNQVAYELAMDNFAEGVRYIEVRFAPQLHMHRGLSFEQVMSSVDSGLRRARSEINAGLEPGEPPFEYGIIVCAMRFFTPSFSDYYAELSRIHPYSEQEELTRMASLELAKATVRMARNTDVQVVAFDLAGSEEGFPASQHESAYAYAHKHFLNKTVHAGEAYGPESIFQAITKLHADRIGHGLRLFRADMVYSEDILDKEAFVAQLANYIAEHRITVEVCLTSNLQTCPDIRTPENHSLGQMLASNLSLSLCTDNRLVSHTTVTKEIELAIDTFSISPKQLKNIIIYGFKRSFHYQPYGEKRRYVRTIIDYYEALERKHRVSA